MSPGSGLVVQNWLRAQKSCGKPKNQALVRCGLMQSGTLDLCHLLTGTLDLCHLLFGSTLNC